MIDFLNSPTDGQTYSYNGMSYVYNNPPGTCTIYRSDNVEAPTSTYTFYVGALAPSPLVNGDSMQWVQI